jgi:hypothetical protein
MKSGRSCSCWELLEVFVVIIVTVIVVFFFTLFRAKPLAASLVTHSVTPWHYYLRICAAERRVKLPGNFASGIREVSSCNSSAHHSCHSLQDLVTIGCS